MKPVLIALSALTMLAMGTIAQAHTTSIGFVPGTNAGEATFWTGSYSHSTIPVNEGTLTLTGISIVYGPVTTALNITPTSLKPTGLVDGTNNFYWQFPFGSSLNTSLTSDPGIGGGVAWWQGVTFTGLSAGTYNFSCGATCGTSVQWATWGPGSETLTLTAGDIGGAVPEPATMTLLGAGMVMLLVLGRKLLV